MNSEKQAELLELIHAVCEGTLSQAQVDRLEDLLRGDRQAKALYLRHVHLYATLRWDLGSAAECSAVQNLAQSGQRLVKPSHRPWRIRLAWAAAAILLVGLTVVFWPRSHPDTPKNTSVAVLAQAINAEWEGASVPTTGDALGPQRLRLREGVARIEFPCGAAMTIEGPAEFTPLAVDRSLLHHGRLTARVPETAAGFVIETPRARLTDPGTCFGLTADESGSVELCVFEGQVAVALGESDPVTSHVQAGEAVRVEAAASRVETVAFDVRGYERTWPISLGVLSLTGAVKFVDPGRHRRPSHHEDDEHLVVFPEHQAVLLQRDVQATADTPGHFAGPFTGQSVLVRAGTYVRTYLVQFNPIGRKKKPVHRMIGSVTFERPVVAVIATSAQLAATDRRLGAPTSPPTGRGSRGLEGGDAFTLSPDRRTLSVDFTATAGVDQLRVLVDARP